MRLLHPRLRPVKVGAAAVTLAASAVTTFALAHFVAVGRRTAPSIPFSHIQAVNAAGNAVGDHAPEITWRDGATGKTVRLSDYRGRPVVLFLASYTCGPFRVSEGLIEKLWEQYGSRVACFLVYSKEAHPELAREEYLQNQRTLADREKAARSLLAESQLSMPLLLDPLDNPTERACGSIPSRIVVIDANGKIAYTSGYPASSMAVPIPGVLDRLLASGGGGSHSPTAKQMPPRSYPAPY